MDSKFIVSFIASFVLIVSVSGSPSKYEEEKKPARDSSAVIKKDGVVIKDSIQSNDIYISDSVLYIKTPLVNDLIYVYTASGLCIDKFFKDTELVVKKVSTYPKGVLIVTNGKDMMVKITNEADK